MNRDGEIEKLQARIRYLENQLQARHGGRKPTLSDDDVTKILQMYLSSETPTATVREISHKYQMSERTIWRIIKKSK
ncbi:helix-turn-helix domain-containing protein [Selenomonas sp. WCA-380-WT-3B 3/]|uniref:Helix-turn-helix domain-containing protein n=1 Tax=Selenomonas montiformis TaxID=2652285 RepID=A0A6I2UWR5_9FIRM|nr:helix-turn-helix domain-containing protein [Selenomonas montiformis]